MFLAQSDKVKKNLTVFFYNILRTFPCKKKNKIKNQTAQKNSLLEGLIISDGI